MSTTGAQMCGAPAHPMAYQNGYPMDQNPTTSHPRWQYQQTYPQQQQQQHQHPERPQYPRSPSRNVDSQTAQWMNQHYMNNFAYSASPAPSIAPSVISQSQYPNDDRMSMLSVNTAMTGHQDVESQRCFSSNGSTCENINPDMAMAQLFRDAEYVLHNWFNIRDPLKRCELTFKLLVWIKNKGLMHLDENVAPRYIQQIVSIIADGLILWTPPDAPPPPEYISLACRLLEVFHKLVQYKQAIPFIVQVFTSTDGERSLKELLCPFIPMSQDPRLDRCSYIVIDFIVQVLLIKNSDSMKITFLKSLKFAKLVHMLIKHLHEAPICNVNVLIILRNIISRDTNIKEYLIRFNQPKEDPLPPISLIRVILEHVFPRSVNVQPQRSIPIISHTCHLLRTLLHDSKAINDFVQAQGINVVCSLLQRINDIRIVKDSLNLFLHVSDSPAFQEVDIPLLFIMNLLNYYQDEDVYKLGTGFLSNIVANKPRFKKDAIQNNAIQLLDMIISKFPRLSDVLDDKKRQLVCEVMSNCLRTLINLLPFWINNANTIVNDEAKNNHIMGTIQKLTNPDSMKKFMCFLSCEIKQNEISNMVEVRSYILRFLTIVLKMPFVSRDAILEATDDTQNSNIVAHIVSCLSWSLQVVMEIREKFDRDQREKLVERAMCVLIILMENSNVVAQVSNCCRYNMTCPLEVIRETQNENFIRTILEFCDKVTMNVDDLSSIWTVDRSLIEGLANNRNATIVKYANLLLSRTTAASSEPLADVFANSEFY